MGTNYYLQAKSPCECCGRPFEDMHIGKSSAGWCFSLHVMPDIGINDLEDWEAMWSKDGARIHDEYGDLISIERMRSIIKGRGNPKPVDWSAHEFAQNYAERGPKICHLLLAGVPIRTVQLYAGHAHISTTEIYAYQVLRQDPDAALRLSL